MILISLWILIGMYGGFVIAHSISQSEIELFSSFNYKQYIPMYVFLSLVGIIVGPLMYINLFVFKEDENWDIYFNIFKFKKK